VTESVKRGLGVGSRDYNGAWYSIMNWNSAQGVGVIFDEPDDEARKTRQHALRRRQRDAGDRPPRLKDIRAARATLNPPSIGLR
jgi:hypothetical protein